MTEKIKVKHFCPFGNECEEIKNNEIHRCHWYIRLNSDDGQGNIIEEWGCAMTASVILQLEHIRSTKGTQAAVESFRNESVKNSELIADAIALSVEKKEPRLIED